MLLMTGRHVVNLSCEVLITVDGDEQHLMIATLRYYDTFVKTDGDWLFAERLLYVDWLENRAIS